MRKLCTFGSIIAMGVSGYAAPGLQAESQAQTPVQLSAPANAKPLANNSSVDDILDALHDSGQNLKSFSAGLEKTDEDYTVASKAKHVGQIFLQFNPSGNPVIKISFDQTLIGDKQVKHAETSVYLIDNGWVTHRDASLKKEDRTQIAPPGQKMNLFQLGQGQFPLPIGQDKNDVYAQFAVTRADLDKTDPPGTIHLVLTPKAGTRMADTYSKVEVWVDPKLKMPVRIYTDNKLDTAGVTVDLPNLQINPAIKPEDVALPPLPSGWDSISKPIDQPAK